MKPTRLVMLIMLAGLTMSVAHAADPAVTLDRMREMDRRRQWKSLVEEFAHVDVHPDLLRKYVEQQGDGCFGDTRPSESQRRLPEAAQDIYELLHRFRPTPAQGLESFRILERAFGEQCRVVDGNEPAIEIKLPQDVPCDNVLNPADPEASYNKHRGIGYMVQIMETYTPEAPQAAAGEQPAKPDLITHVAVGKMNVHDQAALEPALLDTAARGIKPEQLLADSHYGSNECLERGSQHQVTIISPSMTAKGKLQGKLTLEDFELDEEGRVLRCPAGHAPLETRVAEVRLQVLFDAAICQACPHHDHCLLSAVGRNGQRYQYTHDRVQQRQRRLNDASEKFRDQYRWRAGIEGTMSRFKYQMGKASLRVRGFAKISYAAFLRALGLNIRRVAVYRSEFWAN